MAPGSIISEYRLRRIVETSISPGVDSESLPRRISEAIHTGELPGAVLAVEPARASAR
jgi:hypothetical protein